MSSLRNGYIDQWRGISVLMVLLDHLLVRRLGFWQTYDTGSWFLGKLQWGALLWRFHAGVVGVCAFFCISGYLITSLLAKEEATTGRASLTGFYIRRLCRILPALLLYVGAVCLLDALGAIRMERGDAGQSLMFLCNTEMRCGYHFGHFWSLAVEEQFYFFWPLLFIFVRRRIALVAAALVLAMALSVVPALRIDGWLNNGLAFSCISAGSLFALSARFRALIPAAPGWLLYVLLVVVIPIAWKQWPEIEPLILLTLPFLIIATVIARTGRVWEPLRLVGLMSYSLYLWQAALTWDSERYIASWLAYASWFAIPMAWLSYRYVELPFMALGHRQSKLLTAQRSANRPV
ncbi:MAG: acyltransferase [Dokdonella sp.]